MRVALALAGGLIALLVLLALLHFPAPPLGTPPPSLILATPSISGNQTSGWTYLMRVNLSSWVRPGQMPWFNVSFWLSVEAMKPSPVPPGTTLRVFEPSVSLAPPSGSPIAEYNLSGAFWLNGGSAAIQDGQQLVLHGMISPGSAASGPWLEYTAAYGRGTWGMGVVLGTP